MKKSKILVLVVLLLLVGAFFVFDVGQYFSLDYIKHQHDAFANYYQENPLTTAGIFFAIYVAVTGLSLPGAAIMTLLGGGIFGLLWGTVLVSFASTLGATIAFLVSRFLLRDWVQSKFGQNLAPINEGIEKDGAFYLFTLRLVPAFPFFIINLVMGLTKIRTWVFAVVSQIGMLAGTIVFVNAGRELAQLDSLSGILSPGLIASFCLLGIFPLVAKKLVDIVKARRVLKDYPKPSSFDRDMVVVGAGSAGLVSAYIASALKAKVTLVERERMGGDCLNTGCVPSKALIRSARFLHDVHTSKAFGVREASAEFDFADIMRRVQSVISTIEPHDSVERYTELGVECLAGEAKILSPYEVQIGQTRLTTRSIIIAAGARPFVPPIEGLDSVDYLTSDSIWALESRPQRLVVLGGGPIGCELTQAFRRLGSEVTQVELMPRLLPREDPEVSQLLLEQFESEGVDVLLQHKAVAVVEDGGGKFLVCDVDGDEIRIAFDEILVAIGRVANVQGYGLEELGIELSPRRTIETNEYLQTKFPNIYACGDVVGPYQFTHVAAHQAWYASVNALFGTLKRFKVDYRVIPAATFTEPEIARVGLNESEAKDKGIDFEITTYGLDDLDRAIADSKAKGFVKVITPRGKDKILGATVVGDHAGETLSEFVMAMRHGLGLNKLLGTIHIYPTWSEANKYAAGNWKRAHAPQGVLRWMQRYHAWRRGSPS
ncbi:MAG: FAD-dependent oxidoreductase [Gammaproteobacteria bacterium]|nr:FAD-dependent oxidoreductase [Gammaproteobacteria bacterium]